MSLFNIFIILHITINVLILFFLHRFYIFMATHKREADFEIGLWNARHLEFILLELRLLNDRADDSERKKARDELMERLKEELKENKLIKEEK